MCILEAAKYSLDRKAEKATARDQQQQLNRTTGMQGEEFDRRMGYQRASDGRLDVLLDRETADTAGLQDRTFAELLSEDMAAFNEQQGYAREAFDGATGADNGLVTANRRIRLQQLDTSNAERARQDGFQGQADALAAALPGRIGFDAQTNRRSAASGVRANAAAAAMTPVALPATQSMDPTLAAVFQQEASRGAGEAGRDAMAAASFNAYGDAFSGAERDLGSFADSLSGLTTRAQISRSALPDELAVGDIDRSNATARRDFTTELTGRSVRGRAEADAASRQSRTGAIDGNSQRLGDALSRFFGNSIGSEQTYTGNMIGSSQGFENKRTTLANYKMGETKGYSPLGQGLGLVIAARDKAASAAAGVR